jgi:hypothetical protein
MKRHFVIGWGDALGHFPSFALAQEWIDRQPDSANYYAVPVCYLPA